MDHRDLVLDGRSRSRQKARDEETVNERTHVSVGREVRIGAQEEKGVT
jgi:hypothetical protein